jgi:hypothetical protein
VRRRVSDETLFRLFFFLLWLPLWVGLGRCRIKERTMIYSNETCRQLVARDYRLREAGKRPDRWHPADLLLLRRGFYVDAKGELQPA